VTDILALIVIYTIANRLAGDGRWKRALKLPGRPLWWAFAAAYLAATPFVGWFYSALAAGSFLIWRTLGWYKAIDAGTNDGTRIRDFAVMSARGLLLFPIFFYFNSWALLAITAITISACYDLAWHFFRKDGKDMIPFAEILAGAVLGLSFGVMM